MTSVLVVHRDWELPGERRIWGTGGWQSPEEREALDWLTLVRLLGWDVEASPGASGARPDLCAVAADAAERPDDGATLLDWIAAGTTLVAPFEYARSPLTEGVSPGGRASGRALRWRGTGEPTSWTSAAALDHRPLAPGPGWKPLAETDAGPVVVRRDHGRGTIVLLGFEPSAARDASGCATALLVRTLTETVPAPAAWHDLSRTVVLRMDDPGGAQNVYSRAWCYAKLSSGQWDGVGRALASRRGRISVAYSAGFVDDGDPARGRLLVGGGEVAREPGRVHPSPLVRYEDCAGHTPGAVYDYEDEYAGLRALVSAGVASVEAHGYTHVHPDSAAWAAAPDRYDDAGWYRELGPRAAPALARLAPDRHPVVLACAAIERWFGHRPTTLVCPGEQWTDAALEVALDAGLDLVGSYYLGLRHGRRLCWTTHVCAPYLDEPAARWFDSGLPVVGYMHDRDLVVDGVSWLDDLLSSWERAGAERFVDYSYLAALLRKPLRISGGDGGWSVSAGGSGLPPGTTVRVGVRTGAAGEVTLHAGGGSAVATASASDPVTIECAVPQSPDARS